MHFQRPVKDWPEALALMPDGAMVKAFDASVLREAKQRWAAAGRDPARLITCFRHYDLDYTRGDGQDVARWDANFRRFVDRTYLENYAPYIDLVEGLNEFTDTRHAEDPVLLGPELLTMTAACHVWNDRFRGRQVQSADGGAGTIPAHCRFVIGNVPVGNDVPKEFMQLAVETDNVVGYHPYERANKNKYPGVGRDPSSWRFHAGRWHFLEQEYGVRPLWAFTECGPYGDDSEGWLSPVCLGGDEALLESVMRAFWGDMLATPAYNEGRIMGWTGAWFTSGHIDFQTYQYETPQLVRLARAAAVVYRPPAGKDDTMNDQEKAVVRDMAAKARAIADRLDALLAPPKHTLGSMTNQKAINLFSRLFGGLEKLESVLTAAQKETLYGQRSAFYSGPAVEDMALTDAEKQKVIAALVAALPVT